MGGCASAPKTSESKAVTSSEVREAISIFKAKDPTIQDFFDKSYAYAVLPKILTGGSQVKSIGINAWVGGARGQGEVFEQNRTVGYCRMSQIVEIPYEVNNFREIIFFRDKEDLDRFKSGDFAFLGPVSGVALSTGAAANADYESGMAVFVMTDVGLMGDVSLAGQKFKYVKKYVVQ
jgi:hypothetical protein